MPFLIFLLLYFSFLSQAAGHNNSCADFSLHPSDKFQFGHLWEQIKQLPINELDQMILQRQKEIEMIKNHWKEKIQLEKDHEFTQAVKDACSKGSLIPTTQGNGSAYFLYDDNQKKRFVIKPFDEDILCLNNRKYFATPYHNPVFRVRTHIPLYRSAQTETLAYEVASLLGLPHLTPKTYLMILSHKNFHNIGQIANYEKLCSIQEFLPNLTTLQDFIENGSEKDSGNISEYIDYDELENLFILIWCLYDTDAHLGNFYVTKDKKGKSFLIKIDNGLCFPTKNMQLLNILYVLPQAKNPLSYRAKEFIKNIPTQKIIDKMIYYELEDAVDAFRKRIVLLQTLIKDEKVSFREIDLHLRFMESPNIDKSSLHALSLKDPFTIGFSSKEQSLLDPKLD